MTESTDVDTAQPVTRRQLRLQLVDGKAVVPDDAVGSLREPLPGGRRDRRRQGRRADGAPAIEPVEPDPAVLAQQRALTARAAELAARAQRVRDSARPPAAESSPTAPGSEDLTAAHNLAVLATPGFFLRTEGSEAPSGSAPSLVADTPAADTPVADTPVPAAQLRSPEPEPEPEPEPAAPPSTRTGSTASAHRERAAPGVNGDTDPIEARSAFGLDPLDAMTAGLGRMRRLRYAQYSLLGVGAAALCTGIIMIVSSLNG